jgi:hypothetical protein
MESDLLSNVRGNVQTLRDMWSTKVQEKPIRPTSISICPQQQEKKSPKMNIPTLKITNETTRNEPSITSNNESKTFSKIRLVPLKKIVFLF